MPFYGVTAGGAVYHVGRNESITSPSVESRQNLILKVFRRSGVDPQTVTYVEAHGTGTSL